MRAPGTNSSDIRVSADNFFNLARERRPRQEVDWIQRRAVETGGRSFNQDVRTFAMNAGLEGTLTFGEKYYDWEAGYFYGRNKANNTTFGLFNVIALRQALGPSFRDTDGVIKCGAPRRDHHRLRADEHPRCTRQLITQEMLDFTTFTAHDEYNYTQKTYYANIGGDLFDLPGGPLGFSVGLEHRTEDGYDSPDALINSGNTTGNARTATNGGYDVDEAYLELAIPVLADLPVAKLLDFSLATRYSDYSNFGDTLNSKFGFRWKPIEDLMLRGNWSEGFRAPSIAELFAGQADSFPTLSDPCNAANFGNQTAPGASTVRRRRRYRRRLPAEQSADPHHRRRQPGPAAGEGRDVHRGPGLQPQLCRRPGYLAGLVEDQDRGRDHHRRWREHHPAVHRLGRYRRDLLAL